MSLAVSGTFEIDFSGQLRFFALLQKLRKLTKVFFGVMVAWAVVSELVVGVHPVTFVVKIFEPHHPVVEVSRAVAENLLRSESPV